MKFYNNHKDSKIQKHYLNIGIQSIFWTSIIVGGSCHNKKGAHILAIASFLIDQMNYAFYKDNKAYKLPSYKEISRITGIPKTCVYEAIQQLDGVLFTSQKQKYLFRDAIKNQIIVLKSELTSAARYKNEIVDLEKLNELYKKKFDREIYAFKTQWYQELRKNTKITHKQLWNSSLLSDKKYKEYKEIIDFKQRIISQHEGLISNLKQFMSELHNLTIKRFEIDYY